MLMVKWVDNREMMRLVGAGCIIFVCEISVIFL